MSTSDRIDRRRFLTGAAATASALPFLSAASYGRVMGSKEAAAGIGAALGPLVGGFIYENAAQEAAFVVNGFILTITAWLVWMWFRPDRGYALDVSR